MNYSWNIGASGVLTAMYRQDVASNNLANIETAGFKPDEAFTIPREAARKEDGLGNVPSNALLERLGAGVLLAPNRVAFTQGAVSPTGNRFDVAIRGNGFLSVESGKPGTIGLTRDGRMTLTAQGRLITASDGRDVLDANGSPITLDPYCTSTAIDGDGTIRQNGATVARLGFFDVADKRALRKQGAGVFALDAALAKSRTIAGGTIVQGSVERSASDPIRAIMAVQSATNAVQASLKVMQVHDELMNRAINTLGRVSS